MAGHSMPVLARHKQESHGVLRGVSLSCKWHLCLPDGCPCPQKEEARATMPATSGFSQGRSPATLGAAHWVRSPLAHVATCPRHMLPMSLRLVPHPAHTRCPEAHVLGRQPWEDTRGHLATGFVIPYHELFSVWLCWQRICSSHTPANGKNRRLFNFSWPESSWPCCSPVLPLLSIWLRRKGHRTHPKLFPIPFFHASRRVLGG